MGCNRRLGCLNSRFNLPSRCDNVESISLRFEVIYPFEQLSNVDWQVGFLKYIAISFGESDGDDISDWERVLCYLETTTMESTDDIITSEDEQSNITVESTDDSEPNTS